MLTVTGMDHIVLNVADVDRSLRFYGDVLGLGVERLAEWKAGTTGFPSVRISDTTLIDLVQTGGAVGPGGRVENLNHFCLVLQDETLEPVVAELAAKGVAIHTGPARRWGALGNGVSVYTRDPDGNEIELRTYAAGALASLEAAATRAG